MATITGWRGQPTSSIGGVPLREYLLKSGRKERITRIPGFVISDSSPAVVEVGVIDYQQHPSVHIPGTNISFSPNAEDLREWEERAQEITSRSDFPAEPAALGGQKSEQRLLGPCATCPNCGGLTV